ncbi:hypothetical protein SAMN02746041_01720 [Desulfacinum hydrothermale DSM 13146]|uniref:Tetratricopeptide repeat-containing protein n=1 Tax=Desulfacinum hydrothermale DSM 13146 TaxID=1121390 RepID=A0A1W1XHF9_9BACT|nr:hypothetical protein [Desulfacinum hydrothermale]SMC23399.1 hypothetical protein SAMN02746041_01720 [Desulfacinum hydrothermale DSM 13146]
MAGKGLLSCLQKRDLLNRSAVSVDELLDWGRRYEQEGRIHDAVDFYEKAQAREEMERLMDVAVQEGDSFLLRRLSHILGIDPEPQIWRSLADRAHELGKELFCEQALKQVEPQEPSPDPA